MPAWRIDLPPHVAEVVRHLPPEVKRGVKGALRAVAAHPAMGEPLRGELEGLWKFRVRRYRIVYAPDRRARAVRVFAVGHRHGIYEAVAHLLRSHPRQRRASNSSRLPASNPGRRAET
jgi:mRNA interferase RelE/StbE